MIKIKLFLSACFLGILFFITGCGNATKENSGSEKKDSLVINNKQLEKSVGLFKEAQFPFVVDSAFISKTDVGDSLGTFEMKMLAVNYFKHGLNERTPYDLNTFYIIDSIKAIGKYGEYCDSLTIGMTKISTIHALNEFHLDANTLILVWGLKSSSYEACPYFDRSAIYFTIVYKGNVAETFLLGESESWGDAPASVQRNVFGKMLADGTFTVDVNQIGDEDMDLPEVEITKEQYAFAIKDGTIKVLSEKKNPPTKIDRKKVGF